MTFCVHSAIGRCRFTPTKSPTATAFSPRIADDAEPAAPQELVRRQNEQLAQLKEQYLRLRDQLQREQRESSEKLLELQREMRAEQKRVEELEDEIEAGTRTGGGGGPGADAVETIEQIWQLMQTYRDAVRPGSGQAGGVGQAPRSGGARTEGTEPPRHGRI
jgi:hypothetical protein